MTTLTDTVASINETALKVIGTAQARALEANQAAADFVHARRTSLPSWLRLPDSVSPESVVQQGFEFGAKLLEADRTFALGVIDAWSDKTS
jgi:hypothetical protein